jgi:hypothetical protein
MRSKLRTTMVALGALLALGTAGAGAAPAALPEISPTPTEAAPLTFTGSAATSEIVPAPGGPAVECRAASSVTGEFINAKETRNLVVTLNGCKWDLIKCSNTNEAGSERIVSETMTGKLAYLNKTKKEVGFMFGTESTSKGASRPVWAKQVGCGTAGAFKLSGELIASVAPVNSRIAAGGRLKVFAEQFEGKQRLTNFEGGDLGQELFNTYQGGEVKLGVRNLLEFGPFKKGGVSTFVEVLA